MPRFQPVFKRIHECGAQPETKNGTSAPTRPNLRRSTGRDSISAEVKAAREISYACDQPAEKRPVNEVPTRTFRTVNLPCCSTGTVSMHRVRRERYPITEVS
jgi:hypothetical protein